MSGQTDTKSEQTDTTSGRQILRVNRRVLRADRYYEWTDRYYEWVDRYCEWADNTMSGQTDTTSRVVRQMLRVDWHILRVDRPFQRFWETMSCSINYFKNVQMLNFFNETPQLPTKKVPKNLFNAASIFKWWSFPKSSKGQNVVLIFIRFCRFFLWDTAIISILASIF